MLDKNTGQTKEEKEILEMFNNPPFAMYGGIEQTDLTLLETILVVIFVVGVSVGYCYGIYTIATWIRNLFM